MEDRRTFIKKSLGLAALLGLLAGPFSAGWRWVRAQTAKFVVPKHFKTQDLIPLDPKDLDTRELPLTPLKSFRTMGQTDHEAEPASWRMEIAGLVEKPFKLSYDEIRALPPLERNVLLICPGVFANHGRWKGFSLRGVLERAGLRPGASHVTLAGPAGDRQDSNTFPIRDVMSGRVFLAYEVNGRPLPREHGFPVRTVAEGYFGYDWIKYVDRVEVVNQPSKDEN
ncbi:MAG: molybdopterin-dependent oxidoreductase [Proteobacteria bacterium]|nr:molybdopterin-dependent oxidoreductase [Pseudomonadota bacterium]